MALEDDIRTLSVTPLFDELGRDALRLVAFSAERKTLSAGEVLFREGEPADGGYVVVAGEVALARGENGGRTVGPGALIGELALLSETLRPATATAVGQAEVYRIARSVFARLLDEYPDLARKLHARLADRLKANLQDLTAIETVLRK